VFNLALRAKAKRRDSTVSFFEFPIFLLLFFSTPPAESSSLLPNRSSGQDPIGDTQCQIVGVVSLIELPAEPTCHLNFSSLNISPKLIIQLYFQSTQMMNLSSIPKMNPEIRKLKDEINNSE
jgi:hypothetical protein